MADTQTTDNATTQKKVVSVKLDGSAQKSLEQQAQEAGLTTSDFIRKLIADAKANNVPAPAQAAGPEKTQAVDLTDGTIQTIAELVNTIVTGAIPQTIEIDMPLLVQPERDYLRKIAGLQPESKETLTTEEEKYLSDLKAAIEADVRTTLLQKEKSVPMPIDDDTQLQKNMMKKMIDAREAIENEKTPTLTKVFQQAIAKAFFDDARSLYNSNLFKATYGFDYNEFKAVFEL